MSTELLQVAGSIGPEVISHQEVPMVRRERWEELHRLAVDERVPIAELARRFGLDRKTVRRCVREPAWRPYQRPARADVLLAPHAAYLRARAPQICGEGINYQREVQFDGRTVCRPCSDDRYYEPLPS